MNTVTASELAADLAAHIGAIKSFRFEWAGRHLEAFDGVPDGATGRIRVHQGAANDRQTVAVAWLDEEACAIVNDVLASWGEFEGITDFQWNAIIVLTGLFAPEGALVTAAHVRTVIGRVRSLGYVS